MELLILIPPLEYGIRARLKLLGIKVVQHVVIENIVIEIFKRVTLIRAKSKPHLE